MNTKRLAAATVVALTVANAARAVVPPPAAPVSVKTVAGEFVVANGLVEIDVSRESGNVTSIKDLSAPDGPRELGNAGNAVYWDANAEAADVSADAKPPKKGYFRPAKAADLAKVVSATDDEADIVVKAGPTPFFPFDADYHFVVRRGVSGAYMYVAVAHDALGGAGTLWQTRFVCRTATDGTFDYWSTGSDAFVKIPTAAVTAKVMDATFRLADGTVKTKYLNSVYWGRTPVYGVLGHEDASPAGAATRPAAAQTATAEQTATAAARAVGMWMIEASPEYHNGGPVKQGQTVHDNVLLRVLQSSHFGASPVVVDKGEAWGKVYGPFLLYVNHAADAKALWADAEVRRALEAGQWPYAWVDAPDYAKARGTVSGRLELKGGSAAGAWVILAAGGDVPWSQQAKGYQFWTRADPDGSFEIPKVIPGTYTLYASGGDQPEDFRKDGVSVTADRENDLGTLGWAPVSHGKTLWQIGRFDRSAGEFRNGDAARQYQMFTLYPKQFPDDVTFTVGKSDPAVDWNYAQWSWYAKRPQWTIRFDAGATPPPTGTATLTLGFASAQPAHGKATDLRVRVNGTEVAAIHLPKTGTAGYRGGVQDSPYHVTDVTFDAKLFKAGENEVTLAHADAEPFHALKAADDPAGAAADAEDAAPPPGTGYPGQVMYDAIRLEVDDAKR